MKQCPACQDSKPESEFNIKTYKSGYVGLRSYCKDCGRKQREAWRLSSPKDNERNKQYNKEHAQEIRGKKLTKYWPESTWQEAAAKWDALFQKQSGKCAICEKSKKLLHVDHCHTTNVVRGLLCYNCNNGLGRFKDCIDYLNRALAYLAAVEK